ncbi:MAG: crossover junction endodeoxyribonuclease RuvC [Patescibacteria group bacterium]
MKILGIDPGTACVGWGIIEKNHNELSLVKSGCILTKSNLPLPDRLFKIYKQLLKIIKKYKPEAIACEEIFFFKNLKTAIAVSHARGIILLATKIEKIPIFEYTPLQIKQALTGFGRADKQQVQKMVKLILRLPYLPKPDDMADALACAICHANFIKEFRI